MITFWYVVFIFKHASLNAFHSSSSKLSQHFAHSQSVDNLFPRPGVSYSGLPQVFRSPEYPFQNTWQSSSFSARSPGHISTPVMDSSALPINTMAAHGPLVGVTSLRHSLQQLIYRSFQHEVCANSHCRCRLPVYPFQYNVPA